MTPARNVGGRKSILSALRERPRTTPRMQCSHSSGLSQAALEGGAGCCRKGPVEQRRKAFRSCLLQRQAAAGLPHSNPPKAAGTSSGIWLKLTSFFLRGGVQPICSRRKGPLIRWLRERQSGQRARQAAQGTKKPGRGSLISSPQKRRVLGF